ncbi:MAG: hypothetical protein MUE83_10540 [Tabrizicola sp.]|jgi:hypothetical protein|nr:hypothetical protein [Tabrizicola sp.]
MVRVLGLLSVVLLVLTGCSPSETWNQRLTLVIETPQGEALAVEVMPGRWLFALLKGGEGWQGEPGLNAGFAIAVPRGHFAKSAEGVREIVGFPKDTPVEVPLEAWPMLVTFDDMAKPETVREVDPEDLAAVFGEGVRLQAVMLEITEEAVTEGRVEGVLGWLAAVGRAREILIPDPPLLSTDIKNPEIQLLGPSAFSTELYR